MSAEKRVDLAELLSLQDGAETCEKKAYGVTFRVKKVLTLSEMKAMTDFVVETCMVNGVYEPSVFDFAWRIAVLRFFTDLALPQNQEDLEKLAFVLDGFYIATLSATSNTALEGVRAAVMETLEMRKRENEIALLSGALPNPLGDLVEMLERTLEKSNTFLSDGGVEKIGLLLDRLSDTGKEDAGLKLAEKPAKNATLREKAQKKTKRNGQRAIQLSVDDVLNGEKMK